MTTLDYLYRVVIPAAYQMLPASMNSQPATAMLLAIALQESGAAHRRQVKGPARGWWQFEQAGVSGVLEHAASRVPAQHVCTALRYAPSSKTCYSAIEHNDILAACFARCLLWTLPAPLPGSMRPDVAWLQYLRAWRPGKPRQDSWLGHYEQAWALVEGHAGARETAIMTNYSHVVAQVAAQYETAWRNAHTGGPQTEDFIRLLAAHLHATDPNVGLNGKRGNPNDISDDALAVFDDAGDVTDRTGKRMVIIDCIVGAGGANPSPGWSSVGGPSPGAWVQPEGAVTPPGGGGNPQPAGGWTPAHNDLLMRLGSRFGTGAGLARRAAEQFAHSFPSEGWSAKAAERDRPESNNVIARTLNGRLVGYRVVPPATNPEQIPLTGQHPIPVTATDHLGTGTSQPPGPKPPQPPAGGAVPPDRHEMRMEGEWLSAYYASPEGLQRPQGLSINGLPDWEGVFTWLFEVYQRLRMAGKSRAEARAEVIRQIRGSHEWGEVHPGETP